MNDDAGTVHLKDIAARVNADPYIRSSGEDCDAEFVHVCAFPLYLYWGVDSKRLSNVRSELELSFGTQGANGSSQPRPAVYGYAPDGSFWPTDDGPHPLAARPQPDSQGAAPNVSFAVLRSLVAGPGFGQKQPTMKDRSGIRQCFITFGAAP